MSTGEVIAKKRSRPRKDPLPESASPSDPAKPTTTARKSAAPKKTSPTDPSKRRMRKTKSPALEAAPESEVSASPVPTAGTSATAAATAPSSLLLASPPNRTTGILPSRRSPTPTSTQHRPSKILTAVRELSTKASPPAPKPAPSIKPISHPRTPSKTSIPKPTAKTTATTPISPPKPAPHSAPPPAAAAAAAAAPAPPKPPAPKPPIGAMNSKIVADLGTPSGTRPRTGPGNSQLPPNYKPVARKVTMVIVALPIAIVTSYVLWERLVNGKERKVLVPAPPEAGTKAKGPELG